MAARVNGLFSPSQLQWNNQNALPWQRQIVERLAAGGMSGTDAWAELNRQMQSGLQPAMMGRDGQPLVVSNMPVGLYDRNNPTGIAITSNPQLNPVMNPWDRNPQSGVGVQMDPRTGRPMNLNPAAPAAPQGMQTGQMMAPPGYGQPQAAPPAQAPVRRQGGGDVIDPRMDAAFASGMVQPGMSMRDLARNVYANPTPNTTPPRRNPMPAAMPPAASQNYNLPAATARQPSTPQEDPFVLKIAEAPPSKTLSVRPTQPTRPPAGGSAGGGQGWTPGTDPVAYLQQQTDRANAANEGRYQQLLGNNERDLQSLRDTLKGEFDRMTGLVNTGQQANFQREQQLRESELGNMQQSLVSRGLGNTTVRDTLRSGIMDQSALRQRELSDAANNQLLGLYGNYANALLPLMQSQFNQRQGIIEGRVDQAPSSSLLMQLLSQPRATGAGGGTAASGTAAAGQNPAAAAGNPYTMAAQQSYPNPYMQAMQAAGQQRVLRPGDAVPITGGPVGNAVRLDMGPAGLAQAQAGAQGALGGRQRMMQAALGGMFGNESRGQQFSYNPRGMNSPSAQSYQRATTSSGIYGVDRRRMPYPQFNQPAYG